MGSMQSYDLGAPKNMSSSSRSGHRKRLVDPPTPKHLECVSEGGGGVVPNMFYFVLAAAGISMGLGLFLYRDMRKVKTDIEQLQKKTINETKEKIGEQGEALKTMEQKINQLAQNIQSLHLFVRNNTTHTPPSPKPLPQTPPLPNLPKPSGIHRVKVLPGGPHDPVLEPIDEEETPNDPLVLEPIDEEETPTDVECDEGICLKQ